MINKAKLLTLDFWIPFLMVVTCVCFLFVFEVIPSDFFLRESHYKNNPEYTYKKDLTRMMICSNTFYNDSLEKYYKDPESLFGESTYLLKSKFANKKTAVIIIDNVYLVAHSFTKTGFWNSIFSIPFKASEAYRAWHNGQSLIKHHIPCSKPLLVIEKRLGPYCTSSYLVTSYITGLDGAHFFKKNSAFKEKWMDSAINIQDMLSKLQACKIRPLQFSLKSFILKNEIPYLIDLEQLRAFRFQFVFRKKKSPSSYLSILESELQNLNSQASPIFRDRSLAQPL